uniref:Lipocalin/cytosolic fatty-acid binding domain-containing protein n=1 Tax=Amblyomma maculatum TaxID=34609 RepID=G3MRB7_AMBMU
MLPDPVHAAVLVAILSGLQGSEAGGDHNDTAEYDIKKFLTRYEPVWTVYSTWKNHSSCKVDFMWKGQSKLISFNRSYYIDKIRYSTRLQGRFYHSKEIAGYNSMVIGDTDEDYEWDEILFQNDDNTCAVVQVGLISVESYWYELRVKNSSIAKGMDASCLRDFILRADTFKTVYRDTCQKILKEDISLYEISGSFSVDFKIDLSKLNFSFLRPLFEIASRLEGIKGGNETL